MDRDIVLLRDGRCRDRIPVGARFSTHVHTGSWAYTASCKMGTGFFQGIKQPGSGIEHSSFSSAEVKKRVEPFLYSFPAPSWPAIERNALVSLICSNSPRIRLSLSLSLSLSHTHNRFTRQIQTHACFPRRESP